MPKLPQPTAQGASAVLSIPRSGAFGAMGRAGREIEQTGGELKAVAEKIQQQQDTVDLARVTADYEIGLDAIKTKVAAEPDLTQHQQLFDIHTNDLQNSILEQNPYLRNHVIDTFKAHSLGKNATAFIDLSHQAQVVKTQRVLAGFADTQDRLTEQAALDPRKASENMRLLEDIRSRLVDSGMVNTLEAQKGREASLDRFWSVFAQHRPQELLDLVNRPLKEAQQGGALLRGNTGSGDAMTPEQHFRFFEMLSSRGTQERGEAAPMDIALENDAPVPMDAQKKANYVNLAINTLHQQQQGQVDAERAQAKALKDLQEQNVSTLTADVLQGKPILDRLPAMLRSRELDNDKVASLLELQSKMTMVPDMKQYNRGLATQIEASLSTVKYDGLPLSPHVEQNLQSEFLQGHILKDEFQHLMDIVNNVKEHKQSKGNENRNRDVSHAHSNLEQVMQSANKLTGFSAVGEQATAAAREYFYRRVEQEPNASPWDIMHDAEQRFKPIVEKQQGISASDQMLLNEAKRQAKVRLGVLSPAAAKAHAAKEQEQAAQKIVSDTLKALPPPPPPGFLEKLGGIFKKKDEAGVTPRKEPGVMGE